MIDAKHFRQYYTIFQHIQFSNISICYQVLIQGMPRWLSFATYWQISSVLSFSALFSLDCRKREMFLFPLSLNFKEIQWFKRRNLARTQFYWYHSLRAELMAESLNNNFPHLFLCSSWKDLEPSSVQSRFRKKYVINYLWRNFRKSIH